MIQEQKYYQKGKIDGIKEFAEELKNHSCFYDLDEYASFSAVSEEVIDDLLKEKISVETIFPEKPMLYWVSTIIFDEGDIKPWLCAISTAQDTLEQAMYQLEFTRKHHNVLSGWIDVFDEDNTKQTVFHECYMR